MLKELDVKQALQLLAEKYPEPVHCLLSNDKEKKYKLSLFAVDTSNNNDNFYSGITWYRYCYIEVPDEYRYMTQQECLDFATLNISTHQVRVKSDLLWWPLSAYTYSYPDSYEYHTIQEIDGKIVYGEPQNFKVRVE